MLRYLEIKKIESGLERNVSRIKVLTWSNVGSLLSRNCRRRPLVGELAEFPSSDSRAPASCFHQCLSCVWFGLVWCLVFGVFTNVCLCRSKSMLIQLSITSFPRRNQIIFCLTSGGGTATPTTYEIFNIEMFAHTQCTMF